MKKNILTILLITSAFCSSTLSNVDAGHPINFKHLDVQNFYYSVLQSTISPQKNFINIFAGHPEAFLKDKQKTESQLTLPALTTPSFNGMQMTVKNSFQQSSSATARGAPDLSAQLALATTATAAPKTIGQSMRSAQSTASTASIKLSDHPSDILLPQSGESAQQGSKGSAQPTASAASIKLSDHPSNILLPQSGESAHQSPRSPIQSTVGDSNIVVTQATRSAQSTASAAPIKLSDHSSDILLPQSVESAHQASKLPTQSAIDSQLTNLPIQTKEEALQPAAPAAAPGTQQMPPPLPKRNLSEQANKENKAPLNFVDVLGQLKGLDGSKLRKAPPADQKRLEDKKISVGAMGGRIFGKEAQKFAERMKKLREAAEGTAIKSIGTGEGLLSKKKAAPGRPVVNGNLLDEVKQGVALRPVPKSKAPPLPPRPTPTSAPAAVPLPMPAVSIPVPLAVHALPILENAAAPFPRPSVVVAPKVEEPKQVRGFSLIEKAKAAQHASKGKEEEIGGEGDWDNEENAPAAIGRIINPVAIEPEAAVNPVAPRVRKLKINKNANAGGGIFAQIQSARPTVEAEDINEDAIQAALEADTMRKATREREAAERDREARQAEILRQHSGEKSQTDLLKEGLLNIRGAFVDDDAPDDDWDD